MGIRETLSKSKPLGIGVATLMIVVGVTAIIMQAGGGSTNKMGEVFITPDDGKTFMPAAAKDLSTLDQAGKPVVRAHVFPCGGKQVVGYISRYTDESIKILIESKAAAAEGKVPPNVGKLSSIPLTGIEFKRPADANWVRQGDVTAMSKIRQFQCPDGSRPEEVLP